MSNKGKQAINQDTEQVVLNNSVDPDFNVIVVEPVRRNVGETAIEFFNPATEDKQDPTSRYSISDLDESGTTKYYGYLDADGAWYILQLTSTTGRYIKGTSSYSTNWTNRVSLSYDTFDNIF